MWRIVSILNGFSMQRFLKVPIESWIITLVNIKNKQTHRPRVIHVFNITFCSHISVLLYDVSFFAHLKKALGFPRHKYYLNIRPGQMKPHFCEAFFVNTFWTIVIIVLIIEILRQPQWVVSQSSARSMSPPPVRSGESHFINLSYLECIFYAATPRRAAAKSGRAPLRVKLIVFQYK